MNNTNKLAYDILNGCLITIVDKNNHELSILRVSHNIRCCELSIMDLTESRLCTTYADVIDNEVIWHEFIEDNIYAVSEFINRLIF